MLWLLYFGIIALAILIPFIVTGVTTKREEYAFLDKKSTSAMKGVAILCVVVCHYMGTYGNGVTLFTPLGGIGVSVFLILSAYGLTKSWHGGGVHCMVEKTLPCDDPSIRNIGNNLPLVIS